MKLIKLFLKSAGIFIFLLLMAATGLIAANPTYICEIRNDYQIDANTFEFDVYLVRTGADELEYNSFQFGIKLDAGARNGGTITTTFVPNSYEAMPTPLANKLTFQVAKNTITLTATPGGGAGANPINLIPNTQPGRKLGRYHIVNSVPFGQVQPNLTWTFTVALGYPTKLNAYVPYPGGLAAEITVQASHVYNLANPFLNKPIVDQVVTGAGGYCAGGAGLVVGLGGSEVGVTYTLVKDGTPTAVTVAGTGAAVSFPGFQTAGLYTVTAARNATYITGVMTSSALIVLTPLPSDAGAIAGPASVIEGTMGVNYSTTVIPNADTYIWAYSGTGVTIIGDGPAVTLDFAMGATDGNLTVAGHNICGDGVVSAAFPIDVQAGGPTLFNVTGGGSYCQGGVGLPVGLSGSVSGVSYDLYLNGGASSIMTVVGDGNPITFGNQLAGTYTVKVGAVLMNGSAVIIANPLPVATISAGGPTTFCEGGSVLLTASPSDSYAWSTGATTQAITVTTGGSYTVTVTTLGCSDLSDATVVTVNPYPAAAGPIAGNHHVPIGSSGNAYSVGAIANAVSYEWSYSGTGATINGNGTMNITVDFIPTATEGQLHVMGLNACGYGVDSFFDIFFDVPTCVTATWNGSVSEDWNNPLNWDGYCVPTATTNVVIPAGLTNYPTLAAAGACNNIMFGSTAAGTATLLDNGFLTIGGTATVQRFYSANDLDWHLISSPIANATANVFLNEYLQSFNEGTNAYTEITAPATPLNVMEGYGLYNAVGVSSTAVFNGTLNLGTQSHGYTASNLGWNLLGNPFVSSIDWEMVGINVGMSNEVHYIDAATGNDLSYVKGLSGQTVSQYVPPMQGFFVSATAPGTLSVGDAQRSHMGADNFYKSDNPRLVVLEATGNTYSDQALIHFNDQAGIEHDGVYDAYKRISTSNPLLPQLYSTTPSGVKLSVNGMPQTSTVPVGFTTIQSGNYTISANKTGEFTKVTLEDLFNGTFTNLLTDSYSFNYTSGDQENRFLLHFNGVSVNENQADLLNIYSIQKDVYVSVPSNKIGNVKILNMLGQEVAQAKIVDVLTKLTVNQIGIYVVQVKMDNGKIYTKKVIIR